MSFFKIIFVQFRTPISTLSSLLAANVRAAWRRRGVRYSSCGTQMFIFPLHFPRRYTPACAKPPVSRWHFILFIVLSNHIFREAGKFLHFRDSFLCCRITTIQKFCSCQRNHKHILFSIKPNSFLLVL